MKKRLNWVKVIALILMVIEIVIAIVVDKVMVRNDIMVWRLYVACIMFIPMNAIFICIKRRVNDGK